MRFMMMHKLDDESPEAWRPSADLLERMGAFVGEMQKAGVLLAGEGLRPSREGPGARVKSSGGKRVVTDGPFTEATEVVAGFFIVQVESRDEAIAWASRFADLLDGIEVEVRRVAEPEDFE